MAGLAVGADAEHDGVLGLDLGVSIAKSARLGRAARGVVLGIEVKDDFSATKVLQLHGLAGIGRGLEIRRRVAGLQGELRHWGLLRGCKPWFASEPGRWLGCCNWRQH